MPSIPSTDRDPPNVALWAPWLAAPLFALLPIGGCGLAAGPRSAAAHPPAASVPMAPVAPVVPAGYPLVAWERAAH